MDSEFFNDIYTFDKDFEKLLDIDGSFFHRFKFRKCVKEAKKFYMAYVKKCNEYGEYIDFFTPLHWHLIACGIGYDKSLSYLNEIRERILSYLKDSMHKNILKGENID